MTTTELMRKEAGRYLATADDNTVRLVYEMLEKKQDDGFFD